MNNPDRIPVIVGVGQINDRPVDPQAGLDSLGLMIAALRAADEDAGGGWLADADTLFVVDQISFRRENPLTDKMAAGIGAVPAFKEQGDYPGGNTPILRLNEAANRIGAGEASICLVAGAEALRTAAQRKAAVKGTTASEQNAMRGRPPKGDRVPELREDYGFFAPIDIYPLYENAMRPAYGQTLAEGQRESAQIWSLFSEVAALNESAWIRTARSADEIETWSADNRPLAFPYTKLMVANSNVNQGAGFIVTSLAEARRRGVNDAHIVFVGMGAAAQECDDFLLRNSYNSSASMEVVLNQTLALNNISNDELDWVELYSCFPCVPKMARRIIGWPVDRAATVFGGLTFGGGPIANYMSHAVAEMVYRLRAGGRNGLLFANGGLATHNHAIILSNRPVTSAQFPQDFNVQGKADTARNGEPALDADYSGPATVETYTVFYDRAGEPTGGTIIARTPDGTRALARVPRDDLDVIQFLTDGAMEPVGTDGFLAVDGKLRVWKQQSA